MAICAGVLLTALSAGCQNVVGSAPLKVGDCFNATQTVDANGDNVTAYAVADCSTAHDGEAFSEFEYPDAGAWPGYEAIGAVQQERCQADFETYVGVPWERSTYTINYNGPDESTWAAGDHTIQCLLEDASAGKLTGSARGTGK